MITTLGPVFLAFLFGLWCAERLTVDHIRKYGKCRMMAYGGVRIVGHVEKKVGEVWEAEPKA